MDKDITFQTNFILACDIQRRNPFQIERVPWINRIYRYPVDRWPSLARQALFGSPNFLLFWLYKKLCPIVPKGAFKFISNGCEHRIIFDGRNTQFSALYFKAYAGGYEAQVTALIDLLIPVDGVFLDIGSNWGWFSLIVASKSGFCGKIHAFEPFPGSFKDLKSTVVQAGLDGRIECHGFALSDRAGTVSMLLPDKFQSGQAIMQEIQNNKDGNIQAKTLDSLELAKISVIKMDVEGAEAKVIRGAQKTLSRCQPMIIMENGRHFSEIRKTLDPLFLLSSLGYQLFHIAWLRRDRDITYLLGDDDDSDPRDGETLCLVPFNVEERFLRANGMNVFACHLEKMAIINSLFRQVRVEKAQILRI